MAEPPRIICTRCTHYHVTWEPENPHGCRAYGFKAQYVPSAVVRRISGMPCQLYELKKPA